jgi:hypothetical protein
MTAARQRWKAQQAGYCVAIAAGLLLFAAVCPVSAEQPALVVDSRTGLAISGFDPVAYFTDRAPQAGRPDLELNNDGVIWRFRNEGNRAEFAAHADVYAPQFGGYDPVAVANGKSVPGHPLFWSVTADRLYLFYSEEARTAFLADAGRIIDRAMRKWPEVSRTIPR